MRSLPSDDTDAVQDRRIIKRCACGAAYTAAGWARLSFCGEMCIGDTIAELRNCVCGSSLALPAPARP